MVNRTIRDYYRRLVRVLPGDTDAPGTEHDFPRSCGSASEVVAKTGLTAEEHIERLLASADGPIEQQLVVEYTGWSPATVSRKLSAMERDDRITRIRVGRKKLVCLADAEPELVA